MVHITPKNLPICVDILITAANHDIHSHETKPAPTDNLGSAEREAIKQIQNGL